MFFTAKKEARLLNIIENLDNKINDLRERVNFLEWEKLNPPLIKMGDTHKTLGVLKFTKTERKSNYPFQYYIYRTYIFDLQGAKVELTESELKTIIENENNATTPIQGTR